MRWRSLGTITRAKHSRRTDPITFRRTDSAKVSGVGPLAPDGRAAGRNRDVTDGRTIGGICSHPARHVTLRLALIGLAQSAVHRLGSIWSI